LLKNPEYKKSTFNTVNSGHPLFFRASPCKLLKNSECKKYIQYSEKFQGNSVFRARAGYSKLLNYKKYLFSTVNSGNPLFLGQAQVAQKLKM